MIIACINCNKKFDVNSELIPNEGRTIQCGSCNHLWFFKKNGHSQEKIDKPKIPKKIDSENIPNISEDSIEINQISDDFNNSKGSEIVMYQPKINFTFSKFLSYILVILISFIGLLILLDTFKGPIYSFFPNLEFFLFSFYETLKDINLFIKDLF